MKKLNKSILTGLILGGSLLVASCDTKDNGNDDLTTAGALLIAQASTDANNKLNSNDVEIQFDAKIDGAAWDCTSDSLTLNGDSITPRDLRYYVTDVKLIGDDQKTYDVTMKTDGVWQSNGVALIDMQTSDCNDSDTVGATRTILEGTVADAAVGKSLSGVQFTLGVPENLNHQEKGGAYNPSPFNIADMAWSWTIGFKFLKFEYSETAGTTDTADDTSRAFHLGSLDCTGADYTTWDGTTVIESDYTCSREYRPTFSLTSGNGFNPYSGKIVLNLDALTDGFQKDEPSCMPIGNIPDGSTSAGCEPWLENMGLDPSSGANDLTQASVFTLE